MAENKRAAAFGFFDGVHLGHAALLQRTVEAAAECGATPSVLSFEGHPDKLVFGRDVPLINDTEGRKELIRRLFGIEDIVLLRFDRELMCMPWQDFAGKMVTELNVGHIVIGYDFCFGYRGEGTAERLKEYCAVRGVGCDVIPPVSVDGRIVSSTYIRELLAEGRIAEANRCLGHPHTLTDTVRTGFHLGTKLGTPTVNMLFPEDVLTPKHGVYVSRITTEDGASHTAVTNIGVRPTVSTGNTVTVESYLTDFSGDLYGKKLRLEFYSYLRGERKFSDPQELGEQIRKDANDAKRFFAE